MRAACFRYHVRAYCYCLPTYRVPAAFRLTSTSGYSVVAPCRRCPLPHGLRRSRWPPIDGPSMGKAKGGVPVGGAKVVGGSDYVCADSCCLAASQRTLGSSGNLVYHEDAFVDNDPSVNVLGEDEFSLPPSDDEERALVIHSRDCTRGGLQGVINRCCILVTVAMKGRAAWGVVGGRP